MLRTVVTGVTGGAGTDTGLGEQGTAGQGTDLLWDLVGSVAEPYTQTPASGFLLRNATDVAIRKLKDLNGQPITGLADRSNRLGYRVTHDGFMPLPATGEKSVMFGDFSRGYFARIVDGIRFERSDEYAFQEDLVSFKAVIRIDGAQVDLSALKALVNGPAAGGTARSK